MLADHAGAGRRWPRSPRRLCAANSTSPSRCTSGWPRLFGLPAEILDGPPIRSSSPRERGRPFWTLRRLASLRCGLRRLSSGDRAAGSRTDARLAAANELEVVDGRLTEGGRPGSSTGPVRLAGCATSPPRPVSRWSRRSRSATAPTTSTCSTPPDWRGVQRQARVAGGRRRPLSHLYLDTVLFILSHPPRSRPPTPSTAAQPRVEIRRSPPARDAAR